MVSKTDDYCNTKIRYEWKHLIQSPANPGAHLGQRPVAALPKKARCWHKKNYDFYSRVLRRAPRIHQKSSNNS